MRHILRFLAALSLLLPAVALGAGEDCTITNSGTTATVTWGSSAEGIAALSGSGHGGQCAEAARDPDGDDVIIIDDAAATVNIAHDIAFTADTGIIDCVQAAELVIDVANKDGGAGPMRIDFWGGSDSHPGDASTDVALVARAACPVTIRQGWRSLGDATSTSKATHTRSNNTTWFVPNDIDFCRDDTCPGTSHADDSTICFNYTTALHDTADGEAGDIYLTESLTGITDARSEIQMLAPAMEYPHIYPIIDVDETGPDFDICFDTRQRGNNRAEDSFEKPNTAREVEQLTVVGAHVAGGTCVDVNEATIAGNRVGQCWYHTDDKLNPNIIVEIGEGVQCDGDVDTDSYLKFAAEDGLVTAMADTDVGWVAPCFRPGDTFGVVDSVQISIDDGEAVDGEGKIIFKSTGDGVTIRGLHVAGSGELRFDGAVHDIDCLHVREGGVDGGAAVRFIDTTRPTLSCFTVVGGPPADDAAGHAIVYENNTGTASITDAAFRYYSDYAIATSTADSFTDGDFAAPATDVTITAHNYIDGYGPVQLTSSGTLPTPLALLTNYYVNVVDANTIQFSLTRNGTAISLTVENGGTHTITSNFANQGALVLSRVKFEQAGEDAGAVDNVGAIDNLGGDFSHVYVSDGLCKDCTIGSGTTKGDIVQSPAANPVTLQRFVVWGLPAGGVTAALAVGVNSTIKARDLLLRNATPNRGGGVNFLPITVTGCDVRDITQDTAGDALVDWGGFIRNCIFADISVVGTAVFQGGGGGVGSLGTSSEYINNIFWDMTSTSGNCAAGNDGEGGCSVLYLWQQDVADTTSIERVEDNIIGWTPGTNTVMTTGIFQYDDGSPETIWAFGGNVIYNMANNVRTDAVDVMGLDIDGDWLELAGLITTAGPNCVYGVVASGGSGDEDVHEEGSYPDGTLIRGIVPEFDHTGASPLKKDSYLDLQGCGQSGVNAPGIRYTTAHKWMCDAVGLGCEAFNESQVSIIQRSKAF